MDSNYTKIFTGNRFTAQRIEGKLKEIGINPIIKDESDSARLAGFAANVDGELELHVHNDEVGKALVVVNEIAAQ
ncbi:MAG: DUF2007 domain-containing protein [Pricia sp.]|nr:DUF2007 domain-containing protein [Pricia sp.]